MQHLKSLEKPKLVKICRSLIKNNLKDIVIFGSAVKGKASPEDVDICLLFDTADNRIVESVDSALTHAGFKAHVSKLEYKDLFGSELWKTLLHEGFSIKENKMLSETIGIEPFILYEYGLIGLIKTQKQSFAHALFGSGGRASFLKSISGRRIGKNAVAAPVQKSEELRAFLETWKIKYKASRIWM